jgi:AcrR family transcriptional regulator
MRSADTRAALPARRARGRPSVIDAEAVAGAALRLWSERGYQATGWRDIADRSGVSVRTLLRHFSSKAELAWIGVDASTAQLRRALDAIPETVPLPEAVRTAVVASIAHQAAIRRVGAQWLRLVAGEPELTAGAAAGFRPWIDVLTSYIARRAPHAGAATGHALAVAYQAATFAALLGWSNDGARGDPAAAVDETLRWLDINPPLAAGTEGDTR